MATIPEVLAAALKHHQAGQLAKAEELYRQILAVDSRHPDALHLLGVLANQTGHHAAAIELIGLAIAINPLVPAYNNNLGLAWRALGKLAQAAACYEQALRQRPDYAEAHFNLGLVLKEQGKLPTAIVHYREALRLQPDMVDAHNNLGVAWKETGRLDEAIACYQRAIELRPAFAEAHFNLGGALRTADRLDEALACYRSALQLKPDYAQAHCNLGLVLCAQEKAVEAVGHYRRALELQPDLVEVYVNLAAVLARQGNFEEAAGCCRRAIAIKPDMAEAYGSLGNVLRFLGRLSEAVDCLRKDLELRPNRAETYNLLGNAYKEQGKLDEALQAYQRAMQLQPAGPRYSGEVDADTNFLLASQYRPGLSPATLAKLHIEWDDRHAAALRKHWQPHANSRDPERPLRLGFVSADLGAHPVGYFFIRTLENLAGPDFGMVRKRGQAPRQDAPYSCFRVPDSEPVPVCEPCPEFTVVCYSDRKRIDPLTKRFQAISALWRDISGRTDEAVAELVRQDAIDILFEMSGHTCDNRLLVFARKPAPLQVSWIGYEGTTGLRAIDYLLADRHVIPPGAERDYPEKVLRFPDSYVCYDPPVEAPEPGPPPARSRGHATFGSFNNPAKITAEVVDVWAAILRELPAARLHLKYLGLDDEGARRRLEELFAARGVPAAKLQFSGWSSLAELLAEYNRVDVALDPFPFSGGATTCNALWMGVPVITFPGETFAGRHGLSYLSSLGLPETIAGSCDEYVRLAVQMAGDLDRLAVLRGELRQRMAASPLCDGRLHAQALAQLLRQVWREYCVR